MTCLLILLSLAVFGTAVADAAVGGGSIAFATLEPSRYAFDLFAVPNTLLLPSASSSSRSGELRLTDGVSVNYNGAFADASGRSFVFVSDRAAGVPDIYLTALPSYRRRETLAVSELRPILPRPAGSGAAAMRDRPSLAGDYIVYVSTEQPSPNPLQSWAAVYSTHLPTGRTHRLSPPGVADLSPAVSPSGEWTAVASPTPGAWPGDVDEVNASLVVFKTLDGSNRTLVEHHAGWPCWADESTLYFHRRNSDGWWSVHRATIDATSDAVLVHSVVRVTPPGFHAFTPAASPGAPRVLTVAVRRPGSAYRHVELIDIRNGTPSFVEVTRPIEPRKHHFNPFMSPDGALIGYHRCRGSGNQDQPSFLEKIQSPSDDDADLSLFRVNGSFASFSPDGMRVAYSGFPGLFVANTVGSGSHRQVASGNSFSTEWDPVRKDVIYTSLGPDFANVSTDVDIISVSLDNDDTNGESSPAVSIKKLTIGGKNNAFPSPSPDGKWVVFRSGRSGHHNLYIVDAVDGEAAGLHRLTDGPWDDTMCKWSPDGDWIAFMSDRDAPGGGNFALYVIHPDGTWLRRVTELTANYAHPWFSPDSSRLVFTSNYAGFSAEPIGNPHFFQPYGEIFTVKLDGSDIRRLTHNVYEDGTPAWTPVMLNPRSGGGREVGVSLVAAPTTCVYSDCYSLAVKTGEDCYWTNPDDAAENRMRKARCLSML